MTGRREERRGLLLGFTAFGTFWGSWSAALPDVRAQVGASDGELGLALAAVAVAALPAMPLAGRLLDRHGARRLLPGALLLFALAAVGPAFAGSLPVLVLTLLLLGATTGGLDVLLMLGVTGCVVAAVALTQPAYRSAPAPATAPTGPRRLAPLLVVLGLLTAGSFLVEDAVQVWSALHPERTLDAPPWVGGLGPGLFAGAMALGRFAAQGFGGSLSQARTVGGGGAVLAVGVLVLALAPAPGLALVGAAVAGLGVSVLAPTLLSAVGERSEPGRQGADLALVSATGYLGFVLGPPLVGLLSGATTLPTALALLAVVAVAVAVVGPLALRSRMLASPG